MEEIPVKEAIWKKNFQWYKEQLQRYFRNDN